MNTDSPPETLTWHALQAALRECKTEEQAQRLMDAEMAGPARARWVLRIAGRRSALRAERESAELSAQISQSRK